MAILVWSNPNEVDNFSKTKTLRIPGGRTSIAIVHVAHVGGHLRAAKSDGQNAAQILIICKRHQQQQQQLEKLTKKAVKTAARHLAKIKVKENPREPVPYQAHPSCTPPPVFKYYIKVRFSNSRECISDKQLL